MGNRCNLLILKGQGVRTADYGKFTKIPIYINKIYIKRLFIFIVPLVLIPHII